MRVARFHVGVILNADATLRAAPDLAGIVLEATKRLELTLDRSQRYRAERG